jgi:hypothetical protein
MGEIELKFVLRKTPPPPPCLRTSELLGLLSSPSKVNIHCSSGWMRRRAEGGAEATPPSLVSSWVRELSRKGLEMGRCELVRRNDCRALELRMSCRRGKKSRNNWNCRKWRKLTYIVSSFGSKKIVRNCKKKVMIWICFRRSFPRAATIKKIKRVWPAWAVPLACSLCAEPSAVAWMPAYNKFILF